MAAAVAESVLEHIPTAHLAGMLGGDKRNAIPRECTVTVSVSVFLFYEEYANQELFGGIYNRKRSKCGTE